MHEMSNNFLMMKNPNRLDKIQHYDNTGNDNHLIFAPPQINSKCKDDPKNEFLITCLPLIEVSYDFAANSIQKLKWSCRAVAIFDSTPKMIFLRGGSFNSSVL